MRWINSEPSYRRESSYLSCFRRNNCCIDRQGFYCLPSTCRKAHNCPSYFRMSSCCRGGPEPYCCPSTCRSCSSCPSCCQKSSYCIAWLEREAYQRISYIQVLSYFQIHYAYALYIFCEILPCLVMRLLYCIPSPQPHCTYYISIPSIQMSTHDELPEDIRKQISDFEQKLGALKGLKGGARDEAMGRHEKHLKRIRRLMDTYQYSIQSGAFESKAELHKSQYKEFEVSIARLEKGLMSSRNDLGEEDNLFKYRNNSSKNVDVNSRQAVIQMGHQAQKESEDALKRIQRNVAVMDEQADVIVTEMDRQIKKLDEVYDELCDTETTLKRAEKHLKYFAKQIYTDRLMVCIIIVVAIAIIVIIVLAIAGKTPKAMKSTV